MFLQHASSGKHGIMVSPKTGFSKTKNWIQEKQARIRA
jgi:hypothetical protein